MRWMCRRKSAKCKMQNTKLKITGIQSIAFLTFAFCILTHGLFTFTARIINDCDHVQNFHLDRFSQELIMNMICELPAGYRTVFNMYVFEEYSHREIAETLNFSENTSKSQLSKARALLKKKLNQVMNKQTT